MFARIFPASKTGQLIVGPMDQNLLPRVNQSLVLTLSRPAMPVRENLGNRSAIAAPTCAVAAASCRSARRMSGRRLSRSEGNPTSTSGGRVGISVSFTTSPQSAPGCNARRTSSAYAACFRELWGEVVKETEIPTLPPEVLVGLPSDLLRRRPDIRRAERQLAAATAQVGAAMADLFPRFSLTGIAGLESVRTSDWFTRGSRFWSIGPTISWPVFDAGKIRANIEIRNAQQEQALTQYEKSVLTAFQDVETALVNYANEQVRYRSLTDAVAANRRAVAMANELYIRGLNDFLNVLDTQRSLYVTENELAQSRATMATNLVALYKALGGGWESP